MNLEGKRSGDCMCGAFLHVDEYLPRSLRGFRAACVQLRREGLASAVGYWLVV